MGDGGAEASPATGGGEPAASSLTPDAARRLAHIFESRIPGTGEPGGLPSMGSHRVGHD